MGESGGLADPRQVTLVPVSGGIGPDGGFSPALATQSDQL